jgi:hypothetical protein
MKRDMDLVRDILLAVEKETSGFAFESPEVNGYSKEQIVYHIYIMVQGGLIEAQPTQTQAAVIPMDFSFINLTWAGHEFIDTARNEGVWKNAKTIVGEKLGTISVGAMTQLLSSLVKSQLGLL